MQLRTLQSILPISLTRPLSAHHQGPSPVVAKKQVESTSQAIVKRGPLMRGSLGLTDAATGAPSTAKTYPHSQAQKRDAFFLIS